MDRGLLMIVLVSGVLLFVRGSVALCSQGTFDSTCICVNDKPCDLFAESTPHQLCACDDGTELSLENAEKRLQEMNQNGESIHFLYVSGVTIESLEPFEGALGSSGVAIIIKNTSIEAMEPLGEVEVLGGLKIVYNQKLTHLSGFHNLIHVKGDFIFFVNDALIDISGLFNLTSVGGNLDIFSNPALTDISGLSSLTSVEGTFRINHNYALTSISLLSSLTSVGRDFSIMGNDALTDISGLSSLCSVNGSLSIVQDNHINDISGFQKLASIGGDLNIHSNNLLVNISGFPSLESLGGDLNILFNSVLSLVSGLTSLNSLTNLMVKNSDSRFAMDFVGLSNLTEVRGSLSFEGFRFSALNLNNLERVSGDLSIQRSLFDKSINIFSENLAKVGGSVMVVGNEIDGHLDLLPNLQSVCSEVGNATPCGLTIKGNVGYEAINSFSSLNTLQGSLTITNNTHLATIMGFGALKTIASQVSDQGGAEDLSSGLVVAFNKNLTALDFEALEVVQGVVIIFGNKQLNHINISHLHNVTELTRIEKNNDEIERFISIDPLPFKELGCRHRTNMVPYVASSSGNPVFVTNLVQKECVIEVVVPVLVGMGIMLFMIIVSLLLLYNALCRYYSPHQGRVEMRVLVNAFATRLLAVADVFSDVGFIITVFILWDAKEGVSRTSLLVIGILSTTAFMVAELYMIVGIYSGLISKKVMREIGFDTQAMTLLKYLSEEQGMQMKDWFIVIIGLMALDVKVMEYLPWGHLAGARNQRDGIPHNHFHSVAFMAGLIEDVSQIALQIAFIVSIEGDDGWAITGAMASMTISVADAMVKFVFPMLITLFASNRRHLTRQNAMPRICASMIQNDEYRTEMALV